MTADGGLGLRGGELLMIGANIVFTWYSIMAQHWLRGYSQLHITGLTAAPGLVGLAGRVARRPLDRAQPRSTSTSPGPGVRS